MPPEALQRASFSELARWPDDQHQEALETFQRSAREMLDVGHGFKRHACYGGALQEWLPVCEAALVARDGRTFFEAWFQPLRVRDKGKPQGLFTGYYEPVAHGAKSWSPDFPVPLYAKPDDLIALAPAEAEVAGCAYGRRVNGEPKPYFTRGEIEAGALAGRGLEICYLESWVDAFFIQVQGSGRIILPDGCNLRLSYAAKNGRPYNGIGAVLLSRGIGTPATMSMQFLRSWMADHPDEMRSLLNTNQSFVFFQVTENPGNDLGAIGAAKVPLTLRRSLAVDRRYWMFGTPFWLETEYPAEAQRSDPVFAHLMIAQDTGSAIKGLARGDIYWGSGETAERIAGHMKAAGSMVALLPRPVAARLCP